MDPELKVLLAALVEGQVKLAESQAKTDATVQALAAEVRALGGTVRQMSERMDRFAEAVMRGFTTGGEQQGALQARVERLEGAVFGSGTGK